MIRLAVACVLAARGHGAESGLRVVIRNGMGHSFAALMMRDLRRVVEHFERLSGPMPAELTSEALPPLT